MREVLVRPHQQSSSNLIGLAVIALAAELLSLAIAISPEGPGGILENLRFSEVTVTFTTGELRVEEQAMRAR